MTVKLEDPVRVARMGLSTSGLRRDERLLINECLQRYAAKQARTICKHSEVVEDLVTDLRNRGVLTPVVEDQLRTRCEAAYVGVGN